MQSEDSVPSIVHDGMGQSAPSRVAIAEKTPIAPTTPAPAGGGIPELDDIVNGSGSNQPAVPPAYPPTTTTPQAGIWTPYIAMKMDEYTASVVMHWMYLILLTFLVLLIVGALLVWSNYQAFHPLDEGDHPTSNGWTSR